MTVAAKPLHFLGIIGFFIYTYYVFLKPYNFLIKQKSKHKDISRFILGIGLLIAILVIAMANGFYYYVMIHVLFYILYIFNKEPKKFKSNNKNDLGDEKLKM